MGRIHTVPTIHGIGELDNQHIEIHRLLDGVSSKPDIEQLQVLLRCLVNHFLLEEAVLRKIIKEPSALGGHIMFHSGILFHLDQLIRLYSSENVGLRFGDFLRWLEKNDDWDSRCFQHIQEDPELLETVHNTIKATLQDILSPIAQTETTQLLGAYEIFHRHKKR